MNPLYIYRLCVYLLCFILSFYALSSFDYQRFLKRNAGVQEARILYFLLAAALAYLSAQFFMGIMAFFQADSLWALR